MFLIVFIICRVLNCFAPPSKLKLISISVSLSVLSFDFSSCLLISFLIVFIVNVVCSRSLDHVDNVTESVKNWIGCMVPFCVSLDMNDFVRNDQVT